MPIDKLSAALLRRFTEGVESGEWQVIALSSGSSFVTMQSAAASNAAKRAISEYFGVDPKRLVMLAAIASKDLP